MVRRAPSLLAAVQARRGAWVLAGLVALGSASASAGNGGEARSVLRDADRPYTTVAGDPDASAVVQNPANLGYLAGFNAVLDFAIHSAASGRRGNGVGLFAAVPLPWQILSLGIGGQVLWREQTTAGGNFPTGDEPYGKLSFAVAVPLMRWARGLSLGMSYSRLFAPSNTLARGANQFDLAISWQANRYLTLALAARGLNAPRLEGQRVPVTLDPELALRPLGTPQLEFALGMRSTPSRAPSAQIQGWPLQPRGRIVAGDRGVRAYIEAERVAYFDDAGGVDPFDAVRVSVGLQFDSPHVGGALGPSLGLGTQRGGGGGLQGAAGRLRVSHERYEDVLPVRPRRVTRLSLAGKSSDRELAELVWTLDELARRRAGVTLVELGESGFGLAQLEELREALLRLRDGGGTIVAYLVGGELSDYFLASVADRVVAHPEVRLSIVGFAQRTFYWGELLERLGVKSEFVRIAEYKGTPERFARDGPSPPVAAANRTLLTDRWNHVVRLVGRARARDPAVVSDWVDAAPWQPEDARRRGIVDDLAFPDELDAELEAWLGRRVRIEPPPKAPTRSADWVEPAHVAVLHIDGSLVTGSSARIPLLGIELAGSDTISKEIEALRDAGAVKAVVVRINSRGGSVRAAEAIVRELELTREDKPVVVSFGEVATSGGYLIATGGQYIFANATTVTGSIGVFRPKLDLSGMLDRFGVGVDILSIGERAAMASWWKPYSESERAAAMTGIQGSYDRFVDRVAKARSMTPEEVDAVGGGRLWSGVRAAEVGLVDRYGGMYDAVARAARMAGMNPGARGIPVRHYPPPPNLLERLRALFGLELPIRLGARESGTPLAAAADPLGSRALSFADPLLRALRLLPAALWLAEGPEAMALADFHIEFEG